MRTLRLLALLGASFIILTVNARAEGFSVGDRPSEVIGWEIWSDRVISTEDFRGKWLLIDFFATWCGPCMHELPNLVAQTKDLRGQNFEVLAISVDFPGTVDKLKPTLKEHGATYPCIYQGGGWKTPPVTEWGVNGIPAIFLVNPQGVIVATGLRDDKLRPALEYFIGQGENLPPLAVSLEASDPEPGKSIALTLDVANPLRTPLAVRLEATQYVPVFADDDPEHKSQPVDFTEIASNPDGPDFEVVVDTSDWGMGTASFELPYNTDGYYLSIEYLVKMPNSVTEEHPDGVWLGGDYFTQLPALKAVNEKKKAEKEAAEAAKSAQ